MEPILPVPNKSTMRQKDTIDCLIVSNISKCSDIDALKCVLNIVTPLHIVLMTVSTDPNVFQLFLQLLTTNAGVERTKLRIILNNHANAFREILRVFEAKLDILFV